MSQLQMSLARAALALGTLACAVSAAAAGDISGAGSTFVYPIAAKWADAYKKQTGIGLNYQSIGSGGGIKQIKAKTVTFGASDAPLSGDDLKDTGLVQFPIVMGGVVPVVNVPGVGPGQLVLDGPTLADIFFGKITKWNDKAITKLNPGVNLPASAIAVVHRSDGSGTTFNFSYYLAQVSNNWRVNVGVNTALEWPLGIGGKGNEGVANMVTQTQGAIGYVEYAYAKQNKMAYTKMINRDGKTVAPSMDAFQAAAANADWTSKPGFGVILANQPGPQSWPMAASTWVLVYQAPGSADDVAQALKFFDWCYKNGDAMAQELDYVPMPAKVVSEIEKAWGAIKDKAGAPVWKQ